MTETASDYVRAGFTLVEIPRGSKGPTEVGWNLRENCVTTLEHANTTGHNVGLAHAYSGTCAIDFDDLEHASAYLKTHGIDANVLLNAPTAVRISSGRPGRAKLLYRMVTPLPSISEAPFTDGAGKRRKALEFRCATKGGATVQCVLPPSIHPDTDRPYTWEYGDDLIGHWSAPPLLPTAVRLLWESLLAPAAAAGPVTSPPDGPVDMERIRAALFLHDPSAPEDEWHKRLMAVHWETRGSEEGLALADEWSQGGTNYTGRAGIASRWRSWRLDHARPLTLASLRIAQEATADDLDVITEEPDHDGDQPVVGTLPPAQHLCTDQANAQRISRVFGNRLIVCAGRFYKWTGTHWLPDDGEASRCAANLSNIVGREAKRAREKAEKAFALIPPDLVAAAADHPVKNALKKSEIGQSAMELMAKADALEGWSTKCEFKSVQDAAIGMLRKLLTVEAAVLDRDPWALNCLSGTIDLRTGELRAHNPKDFITRLAPASYDPLAPAARFEAFVLGIMDGNVPRAQFLQRWFGYCATGDVREQKLVCHMGPGANGKGTLLNAVTDVLGDYVGTAAPGLLTSSGGNERHPTEIADLFGKRMVTAHESEDAAILREGFVKQATGGDKLKGRWMRADFFEFYPTHKLQLLTNHRPTIKGSDYGIWRRILLVPYAVRFGTEADILAGRADQLRNDGLAEALREERAGVLRWVVDGAVEWYQNGLNAPDTVLAAVKDYQKEQDRIGTFVEECCELTEDAWAPYSGFGGLYPAYQAWCKESGYNALGKGRFLTELGRVVPFYRKEERKLGMGANRRSADGAVGVRLKNDDFDALM